jgi:hypothetical protein
MHDWLESFEFAEKSIVTVGLFPELQERDHPQQDDQEEI